MKIKTCGSLIFAAASTALLTLPASAQITGSLGTTSVSYSSALSVQTINSGFGASTGAGNSDGDDYNGSELDAAYGVVSGGNLYLFLSGDIQGAYSNNGNSQNSIQVFIGGGGSTVGQTTLSTSVSPLSNMNGSTFASGMNATLGLTFNDYQGTVYADVANLQAGGGGYLGSDSLTGGIGSSTETGSGYSIGVALNNTLVSTMGTGGTALSGASSGANTTTGLELAIPLADLGTISGNIDVVADINNGNLNYLSNQTLPGQAVGTGNLGGSTLSDANYFVVAVPEPSTWSFMAVSGLGGLFMFRRRK